MTSHLDETGEPCRRHPSSLDNLLSYAAVGSRASGFHHDAASKLQSLMMALDEISEIIDETSELRPAADTAQAALRELHILLTANRALAKSPQRSPTPLGELVTRGAARSGVKVKGVFPELDAMVAPPSATHALAILLDLVAGAARSGRSAEVVIRREGDHAVIAMTGPFDSAHANQNELIEIVAYMVRREDGALSCAPNGFVVRWPLA